MSVEKRGRGRPAKIFTEEQQLQIVKLSELHCTQKEIADVMDVSLDVIRKQENLDLISKGKSKGKIKLRQAQMKSALNGSVVSQIWLGKNMLSQSDQYRDADGDILLPWNNDE
tara:strand:+ start:967 stop:1305 length:339 start_codon:yes stop_codon:yes gene_type:complete